MPRREVGAVLFRPLLEIEGKAVHVTYTVHGFGDMLALTAGVLPLAVAGYAFRLNRLFGSRRVGWWLSGAFALQALLSWIHASGNDIHAPWKVEALYITLSLMLLGAMLHIEKLQKERVWHEGELRGARNRLEEMVAEKTAELSATNRELNLKVKQQQEYERELRSSEEQYRYLFDENPQPMWLYDRVTLQFINVNAAGRREYNLEGNRLRALTVKDIRPAEDIPAFLEDNARATKGVEARGCWRHYKHDGTVAQVDMTVTDLTYEGRPSRLVLATDITDRLELERRLRQGQKMEAIGQLAGGVAHDFNNLLTVMNGYSDLLLRSARNPEWVEPLRQISAAGERAAGLTRQLLAFSRRHHLQLAAIDVNQVIANLTKMLRRLIGEDIILETTFSDIPRVTADAGMIEQIILNLTVNARDAMTNGGIVTVSTAVEQIDAAHAQRYQDSRVGEFVRLSVRDTGCGMMPDVVAHLFEPFFTTKDVGKGTGLGLATVYGIVQQHSGWIEVETAVGSGSEFRIYLPPATTCVIQPGVVDDVSDPGQGRGTVLLVEDEETVRNFAALVLTEHGYKVIEADSGKAALEIWAHRAAEIDVVFTDMVMPGGISGRHLAEQFRRSKPEARIVFTSGYSPSRYGQNQHLLEGLKFVPKPYKPDKLLGAIKEALTQDEGGLAPAEQSQIPCSVCSSGI